jgi:hypothetical protein
MPLHLKCQCGTNTSEEFAVPFSGKFKMEVSFLVNNRTYLPDYLLLIDYLFTLTFTSSSIYRTSQGKRKITCEQGNEKDDEDEGSGIT